MSMMFAPAASAGCGKELGTNLTVVFNSMARGGSFDASAAVSHGEDHGSDQGPATERPPVGMWLTSVILGGQTIYQSFESFTSDGLEFLNDNGSPSAGNVCFGVWSSTGKNTYKIYHPSWSYDDKGNLNGTVVIKETITIQTGGNSFKGTVTVDSYDLNGKVSAPELVAQITGTRINAQ
jgi:hypothetical protein